MSSHRPSPFLSYFEGITDFRVVGRCLHNLEEILCLVLFGILADCDDFQEIVDFSTDNISVLRTDFGFVLANGIPSVDTFERVFKHLKISSLKLCYDRLLSDLSMGGKLINIDGKEMRSCNTGGKRQSPVQVVNAWIGDYGLSFGQSVVEKKSNEIVAIPEVLELIDCKNAIISIDAIGCQTKIAERIVAKGANYLIALKENQKALYEQTEAEMLRGSNDLPLFIHRDLGHGRAEERRVWVLNQLTFVEETEKWEKCKSLIRVERKVWRNGKETISNRFFISSLENPTPEKMYQYTRKHWSIENQLHWHLDVTFGEDKSAIKRENAIVNLHIIRKWALFLLNKNPDKISLKRKRKKIARDIREIKKIW